MACCRALAPGWCEHRLAVCSAAMEALLLPSGSAFWSLHRLSPRGCMPPPATITWPEAVAPGPPLGRYPTPSCAAYPLGAEVPWGAPVGWLAIHARTACTRLSHSTHPAPCGSMLRLPLARGIPALSPSGRIQAFPASGRGSALGRSLEEPWTMEPKVRSSFPPRQDDWTHAQPCWRCIRLKCNVLYSTRARVGTVTCKELPEERSA